MCGVSNIADAERKCHAHKHQFMGSREGHFAPVQIQAFEELPPRRFLGNSVRDAQFDFLPRGLYTYRGLNAYEFLDRLAIKHFDLLGKVTSAHHLHREIEDVPVASEV